MISVKMSGLLEVKAVMAMDLRIITIVQLLIVGFSAVVSAGKE